MNKQQLLDELNRIMNAYSGEDSFENGVITGLATAIAKIGKLDEPEHLVIPRDVAYNFETDTRRKLEEFLKDPDKNASSIELCRKILESDIPF